MLQSQGLLRAGAGLVRHVLQATEHSLLDPQRGLWSDTPGKQEVEDRESFYDSTVEAYAEQPIVKLTLKQMLEFGEGAWYDHNRIIESAEFVREELPKRLARRLMDLQLLPYIVVTNPHIKRVYDCYFHAFNELRTFPPVRSLGDNERFSSVLRRLVDEHAPMLDSLASGLRECRLRPIVGQQLALDGFLENMLRSRISRRVLAEQHINLHNGRAGYIGVIATDLSIADSVDLAAGKCRQVCIETYGVAPDVLVSGDTGLHMAYIPAHLDYMLYELLKNSARAVVERHRGSGGPLAAAGGRGHGAGFLSRRLPPVLVRICNSEDQVTIRISDQGGGIPRNQEDKVWQYGFTTTTHTGPHRPSLGSSSTGEGLGLDNEEPPVPTGGRAAMPSLAMGTMGGPAGGAVRHYRMAGLGFGLPLSRLYARYFGGDLRLVNMAGYGVDAFLTLHRLDQEKQWQETPGDDAEVEPLLSIEAAAAAEQAAAVAVASAAGGAVGSRVVS